MESSRWASLVLCLSLVACGGPTDADVVGVGAQCAGDAECPELVCDDEPCPELICLTQFAGGYCGLVGCQADADCPLGSGCVRHDDGVNYCFRLCDDKPECNANRDRDNEANCVGSVTFVDVDHGKACEPPSSG